MKHSKIFLKLLVFFTTIISLTAACQKKEKEQNKEPPLAPKVDASLKTPTNYCEKTFYCSFKKLISDDARKVMNYKRKDFLKNCHLALSKLPDKMVKEFNSCLEQKCGSQFRKCIMKISNKYIIPPEEEKNLKKQSGKDKNKTETKAKTTSISETENNKTKKQDLKKQSEKDKNKTKTNKTKKQLN